MIKWVYKEKRTKLIYRFVYFYSPIARYNALSVTIVDEYGSELTPPLFRDISKKRNLKRWDFIELKRDKDKYIEDQVSY